LRWPGEVAAALGVGDDFVKRHGLIAELRAVRLGSQRFVPVAELERWLAERARLPLEDEA
jgi:excisionase family DNA binding protein